MPSTPTETLKRALELELETPRAHDLLKKIDEHVVKLIEELKLQTQLLKKIQESSVDPSPWTFKLAMEYNTGTDFDGNGMIYGRDFAIGELSVHVPASLQPINEPLARVQNMKLLSWDSYADTLPRGELRDQVEAFARGLPERINRDDT
jgi:hypothetical protein